MYFTIQPGSAWIDTPGPGPKGCWLVHPNYRQVPPGQKIQFYHYDPDQLGWFVYGTGTVTANGAQVVPDATTRVYEFTGNMINFGWLEALLAAILGGVRGAEPVDPATGVYVMQKTDLFLPERATGQPATCGMRAAS